MMNSLSTDALLKRKPWIRNKIGIFCPSCEVEFKENWIFCPNCGWSTENETTNEEE